MLAKAGSQGSVFEDRHKDKVVYNIMHAPITVGGDLETSCLSQQIKRTRQGGYKQVWQKMVT